MKKKKTFSLELATWNRTRKNNIDFIDEKENNFFLFILRDTFEKIKDDGKMKDEVREKWWK